MRNEASNRSPSPGPGWAGLFVLFLLLYALTASRGIQWQDSGVHIVRILTGELLNPRGLALSHPLHFWFGRAAIAPGLLEPSFAITLVSALCGAMAVANVFGCVLTLTRSTRAGVFAAVSFGFAHTFWQMSTVAEVYPLTAALLSAECWCLAAAPRSRRGAALVGLALFNGLGFANHNLALLTLPVAGCVVFLWSRDRRGSGRVVAMAVGAWILGSLPYTGLIVREWLRTGEIGATIRSSLFGHSFAQQVLTLAPGKRQLLMVAAFFALNFPNLFLPLAIRGIWDARRCHVPALARGGLLASLLLHFVFAVRYPVIDQHTFFVSSYLLLAIFAGIGWAGLSSRSMDRDRSRWPAVSWVLLLFTPVWYAFAPDAARRLNVLQGVERHKPYRDDYINLFSPWSGVDTSAEKMSRQAASLAGPDGLIVVEDPMAEAAVQYHLLRDGLGKVSIVRPTRTETIDEAIALGRAVVLVPLNANAPTTSPPIGSWKREGDLYVLDLSTRTDP